MTAIYTIQNEKGDTGFLQRIEGGREYDDVNGDSCPFNTDYAHCYNVISKHEYDLLIQLTNAVTIESVGNIEMMKMYQDMFETLQNKLLADRPNIINYLLSKF